MCTFLLPTTLWLWVREALSDTYSELFVLSVCGHVWSEYYCTASAGMGAGPVLRESPVFSCCCTSTTPRESRAFTATFCFHLFSFCWALQNNCAFWFLASFKLYLFMYLRLLLLWPDQCWGDGVSLQCWSSCDLVGVKRGDSKGSPTRNARWNHLLSRCNLTKLLSLEHLLERCWYYWKFISIKALLIDNKENYIRQSIVDKLI